MFGRSLAPTESGWAACSASASRTVEKMRTGCRASRNELTRDVLRDYRYIEASGLGIPRKIVAGMRAHNGTDPDLIEEDYSFTVRLWKSSAQISTR